MTYQINFTGQDKAQAKAQAEVLFDAEVADKPVHARDKAAALANVGAAIDLLTDDPSMDIEVQMNGYISGTWEGDDVTDVKRVTINVSAVLRTRK